VFFEISGHESFHIRTVGDQHILALFHRRLVLDDAVLGNAHAVKPRTQRAQTTHQPRAFQCTDNVTNDGTRKEQTSDTE